LAPDHWVGAAAHRAGEPDERQTMGLDIYAVRSPVLVKPRDEGTDEDADELTMVYNDPAFQGARMDGRPEGFYRAESREHYGGWSYGGYNKARELICRAAFGVEPQVVWNDPESFDSHPVYGALVSLIHFSDCEGATGPVTSRGIADALEAIKLDVLDADDVEYASASISKLLGCFRDAAEHDGFAVWS
jgi:hypothetical protein